MNNVEMCMIGDGAHTHFEECEELVSQYKRFLGGFIPTGNETNGSTVTVE